MFGYGGYPYNYYNNFNYGYGFPYGYGLNYTYGSYSYPISNFNYGGYPTVAAYTPRAALTSPIGGGLFYYNFPNRNKYFSYSNYLFFLYFIFFS